MYLSLTWGAQTHVEQTNKAFCFIYNIFQRVDLQLSHLQNSPTVMLQLPWPTRIAYLNVNHIVGINEDKNPGYLDEHF